jgi:hypothetical protein
MSILTIAQNIAMETGFTKPSSLVSNTDEIAIQLLALIKVETRMLSDRFLWNRLVKRGTFNFVNGQDSYTLPTDFKDYIPNTMWNATARRPLVGPITPEEYEIQKNYLVTSAIDKMVYIYNNTIYITPTPSTTDTINYEYTTLNIYQNSGGTGKADITLDTDVTTIREYLVERGVKLRFMVAKGLVAPSELEVSYEAKDYEAQIQKAIQTDGFGQKQAVTMSGGGDAYWKAAYTQDSNFPSV